MSPEQAKGKETDRTTDEMLTGRAVFEGETTGEILGGIFRAEPDWRRLPAQTPEGIRRLLGRCLEKERSLRLHDIADARIEIHHAQHEPHATAAARSAGSRRTLVALVSALLLISIVAAFALVRAFRPLPSSPEMRLEIATPPTADPVSLAISPDGQQIVFVATSEGANFEEHIGQFSPDGKWIAYQSNESGRHEIYVQSFPGPGGKTQVSTNGGAQVRWRRDGKKLFYIALDNRLMAVPHEYGYRRSRCTDYRHPELETSPTMRFTPGNSNAGLPNSCRVILAPWMSNGRSSLF